MQKYSASFFLFLASVGYGSLGVIAKFAYESGASPNALALSQMFFGLFIFIIFRASKIRSFFRLSIKNISLISTAGLASALTAYFYYESLKTLNASTAIIMLFQFVWIGIALELALAKRAPSKAQIVAILLCYAGAYLSVGMGGELGGDLYSLFLGLLSGVSFAAYIYISSNVCLEEEGDARAFWVILSAVLASFALTVFDVEAGALSSSLSWGALCGLLGVFAPFYIYAHFAPRVGASLASLIASAELPSAIVLSAIFLNEKISLFQIAGSILVILAVFVVFAGETKAK